MVDGEMRMGKQRTYNIENIPIIQLVALIHLVAFLHNFLFHCPQSVKSQDTVLIIQEVEF